MRNRNRSERQDKDRRDTGIKEGNTDLRIKEKNIGIKEKKGLKFLLTLVLIFSFILEPLSLIPVLKPLNPASPPVSNPVYAAEEPQLRLTFDEKVDNTFTLLDKVNHPMSLEGWHYSGGYWKFGGMQINDSEIPGGDLGRLENIVTDKMGYPLEINYPVNVRKALAEGKKVMVQVKSSKSNIKLQDLLKFTDQPEMYKITNMTSKFKMNTHFKFNFQKDSMTSEVIYYNHFGLDTGFKMPFVAQGYGENGYSIWPTSGKRPGEWATYAKWGDTAESGKIHPSIINKNGTLKPGYTINTTRGDFDSSKIKIGEGTFNSGGAVALKFVYPLELNFYIEKENKSGMIMRELDLVDPDTGKVVESFYRQIDALDPLNISKQKLVRTNTTPYNASILKRNKEYTVRAKYQFISFTEGNFDITKAGSMTEVQRNISTKIIPNQLDIAYSYDNNAMKDGVFDYTGKILSKDKPYVELKNLETASFEWKYEVPDSAKKYVKIAGIVPTVFAENEVDLDSRDNWSLVFGRVEPIDIGMNKGVKLFNKSGESINTYKTGEPYRLMFPVEHVLGEEAIGTHAVNNPKVIINVEIRDEKDNVFFTQRIQTPQILNPKTKIDMPQTNQFTPTGNKFTACATIDPIHKEKGYNDDEKNDKICVTFRAKGIDIGINPPLTVLGSIDNKYIEPNKPYRIQAQVKHFVGDEPVGTNAVTNPRVRVIYTAYDARGVKILSETTVQAGGILSPGGTITMPQSPSFSTFTGMATVCAEIDPIHASLGYNFDSGNDKQCQRLGMIKNYSVRDVKATPMGVHLKNGESYVDRNTNISFTISNESLTNVPLSSSPNVVVRYRGTIIWQGSVNVAPNKSVETTITRQLRVYPGDNVISVQVNLNPRVETEFVPNVSNPYLDNTKTTAIRAKSFEKCEQCMTSKIRTRNEWGERWYFDEQWGDVSTSTYERCGTDDVWSNNYYDKDEDKCGCAKWGKSDYRICRDNGGSINDCWDESDYQPCDLANSCTLTECDYPRSIIDVSYEYCAVKGTNSATKDVKDYYETFEIKDVLFGSKYYEDKGSRMVSVKSGKEALIKAGYGFELKIVTKYETNRYIEEPFPDYFVWKDKDPDWEDDYYKGDKPYNPQRQPDGYCDWNKRRPITAPVWSPDMIYLEMPYTGGTGTKVCYILKGTHYGSWYNHETVYELPLRNSFGRKEERKIYINENAKPNNVGNRQLYEVNIITPRPDNTADRFFGYDPGGYQIPIASTHEKKSGTYLHDCDNFYIIILPQDDMKTHIVQ